MAQHVVHCQEHGFVVLYHATVGADVHLAVTEGIEGVYGLVRRHAQSEMHLYLDLGSRIVVHLAHLEFAFLYGTENGVNQRSGGLAEWYFTDNEGLAVQFLYLGSHLERASSLPFVVFAHIDGTSCGEVGIEHKVFSFEIADGCIADFIEVVGKNLGRQSHGNAFRTLCQQERKLHWQGDRLFVSAVVAELPFGGFGIEHGVEGKLRQACLYVSGCCRTVAGEDVSPVALRVHEQVFLSHLHQGVTDRCVTMGVKLHGMSHNVGHLVVASVVHAFHGVKNASLHGFQSVLYMGNGTFQDYIRGIVEEPVLIHAAQMVHGRSIKPVHWLVVGMALWL